ncbi:hypothetical protein NW762_009647 [Fusarium torreyae]|uniref:Uncharacterized protein n=1 Tax=Fusarium torreyae TaxID=1237075 RepID=A0A9W8RVE6_9HYPO|nr:hypothetical protein NW762_009647 [Fusarium torreyae]
MPANKFVSYFSNGTLETSTHFALSGRTHPVQVCHLKQATLPIFNLALMQAKEIHETSKDGDILIFFQSVNEVEEACSLLRKEAKGLKVLPLYS